MAAAPRAGSAGSARPASLAHSRFVYRPTPDPTAAASWSRRRVLVTNLRALSGRAYPRLIGLRREPSWLFFEILLPFLTTSAFVFVYRALAAPPEYIGFVVLGGALRLAGIDALGPYVYHPDEWYLAKSGMVMVRDLDPLPHFYQYPSLMPILSAFVAAVVHADRPLHVGQCRGERRVYPDGASGPVAPGRESGHQASVARAAERDAAIGNDEDVLPERVGGPERLDHVEIRLQAGLGPAERFRRGSGPGQDQRECRKQQPREDVGGLHVPHVYVQMYRQTGATGRGVCTLRPE